MRGAEGERGRKGMSEQEMEEMQSDFLSSARSDEIDPDVTEREREREKEGKGVS